MRSHSKKIIELDPGYEHGAGYFMLGAVHFKSPYIPFLLSWPNNKDALKWLDMSYNTGDAKLAQGVYLAQSLYKDGQKNEAINLLDKISKATPSKDDYASDWEWIKKAKELNPNIITKSSVILGMGETDEEINTTFEDLRLHEVDIVTLGQYLRPTLNHLPIDRWVTPDEFEKYRKEGLEYGFKEVVSGPFVRSSYRAERALEFNNVGLA